LENLDNAINSLSDQTKKINIAMYYVGNDMDKAKKMVANSYNDQVVLKGNFSSSTLYGAFMIFLNTIYGRVDHSIFVISHDYEIANIAINSDWKILEKDIIDRRNNEANLTISNDFSDRITKSFTPSFLKEINELIKKNEIIQLYNVFQKLYQSAFSLKRIDLSLETQACSSLQMEIDSQTSRKINAEIALRKKEDDKSKSQAKSGSLEQEPTVGVNGVKIIIKGTLILSPIKGKHIGSLVPGDKVMLTMVENTPQVIEIAKAFSAYKQEENRIMPIPARITMIQFNDSEGFQFYAIVAKGIYCKIVEEETNIKVALDPSTEAYVQKQDDSKTKIALPFIIGLTSFIVILIIVMVFLVF